MTTSKNSIYMAVFPGLEVTFAAMKNSRPKVYSGTIKNIDKNNNLLEIENKAAPNKAAETIALADILSFELSDVYYKNSFYAARFASFIDANGHQQWVQGNPPNSIPDSAGVPAPAQTAPPPSQSNPGRGDYIADSFILRDKAYLERAAFDSDGLNTSILIHEDFLENLKFLKLEQQQS